MTLNPPSLSEIFPDEVLLHIFMQDLDITDLKAIRAIGKKWRSLATHDEIWRNIAKKNRFYSRFCRK